MADTGQGSLLRHAGAAPTGTGPGQPGPAAAGSRLPADIVLRAWQLEELFGDPRDPAQLRAYEALAASGTTGSAALRERVAAELLPPSRGGRFVSADLAVPGLRPLLRRDAALGHSLATAVLFSSDEADAPMLPQAVDLARLLAPVALSAAVGTTLRCAVRAVVRGGQSSARWRLSLAGAFTDLLACESLLAVALRTLDLPPDAGRLVRAAAGHVVPGLLGEVLDEVALTLSECGFGVGDHEMRLCAKAVADMAYVREASGSGTTCRTELVSEAPAFAAAGAAGAAGRLFGGTGGHDAAAPVDCGGALLGVLVDTATGVGEGSAADPAHDLARVARRLLTEYRLLGRPGRRAGRAVSRPPTPALADRYARIVLACTALGVHRDAAAHGSGFLARPEWALLALSRTVQRLGVTSADPVKDPRIDVAAELEAREWKNLDCDLHATRTPW
ncbi:MULTISPECIES: hypothetical protein [unclassified Streptomyces]|uniref:hypothetical protein n=1 Tax=unclassified Streptomyces TaxID=2593676 RepID=UPI0027417875|nr:MULTISPECIES: hypothetical protein [unclassified Streptomyces]